MGCLLGGVAGVWVCGSFCAVPQTIRIGDVPPSRADLGAAPASWVETSVTLTGSAPVVLSQMPPTKH